MSQTNIDTALLAFKFLAEGHKAGSFDNYIDLLTEDYTFYAPAGSFRGKNVGTILDMPYFNRIAASFDINDGKVYGYREYFGDIDMEAMNKMQG